MASHNRNSIPLTIAQEVTRSILCGQMAIIGVHKKLDRTAQYSMFAMMPPAWSSSHDEADYNFKQDFIPHSFLPYEHIDSSSCSPYYLAALAPATDSRPIVPAGLRARDLGESQSTSTLDIFDHYSSDSTFTTPQPSPSLSSHDSDIFIASTILPFEFTGDATQDTINTIVNLPQPGLHVPAQPTSLELSPEIPSSSSEKIMTCMRLGFRKRSNAADIVRMPASLERRSVRSGQLVAVQEWIQGGPPKQRSTSSDYLESPDTAASPKEVLLPFLPERIPLDSIPTVADCDARGTHCSPPRDCPPPFWYRDGLLSPPSVSQNSWEYSITKLA